LPSVSLSARATRSWGEEAIASVDSLNRYGVDLGLTVPIYAGGLTDSQVVEARARKEAQSAEVDRLKRLAMREVESAFLDLQSAHAADMALKTALSAANEALDGVEREFSVGTRSALDLLDAQNEAFSVQTELAKSRFAIALSQFRLLSAMGMLTLDALKIAVLQDMESKEKDSLPLSVSHRR
ncbi:MAG: TolC family protein, partial [Magnetococcales bacterium]|nr:TolC family protein [Magnetococcales bacterium]